MRQLVKTSIATIAAMFLASCFSGRETPAKVTQPTGLFATESDVAIDGSLNHPAPKRLADLQPDTIVAVLSDTYGKDYWACYVRTENAVTGWVLCTSLDYQGAGDT